MICQERFKRVEGETFHQKGQKVWLLKEWTVTVRPQKGKSLGEVAKDSIFPDLWVDVDCWNKDQVCEYSNRNHPQWVKDQTKRKAMVYANRNKRKKGS